MALYHAFISYSHAKDKPIAAALQSAIQKLGKRWYRRRAVRIFRDDTSLSATPHLWSTIEQALGQSGFFLLLASPEAAKSRWVNKEVSYWLEHNSIESLMIGLTDGELIWDEASADFVSGERMSLPPVLANRFPSEPKWVDLRPYRDGGERAASRRGAKFAELAADFAAAIRGMPKEDLLSLEVREQRQALMLACSAALSLLILAAAATLAGVLAYWERHEVIAQRDRAEHTLSAATQLAYAEREVQIAPTRSQSWNSRCWAHIMLIQLESAQSDCDEALRLAPNNASALTNRGLIEVLTGQYSAALADYNAALELNPNSARALFGRGIAELKLNLAYGAAADIEAAKANQGDVADDFAELGVVQGQLASMQ